MNNSAKNRVNFPDKILALGAELNAKLGDRWSMAWPQTEDADIDKKNPFAIGASRSWVPILGEVVWQIPESTEAQSCYAYIGRVSDGRQVGYVRVPDYNWNPDAVKIFEEEIIARFESATAAMVFDQVNNNGGSMFQMYALLERLTDRALALPQHQIMIDDEYAALASDIVANAEEESPQRVAYARFVLSERAAGRGKADKLTNPVYLEGESQILPAKIHYTRKIIVLMNELTFSAGEFLAAILQDNKRATLFGKRTAGAGGCQKRNCFPNNIGMEISLTWTIARRTNGEYIENNGILPDIAYEITAQDIQSGFSGYRQTLLAAIWA
jgi:C-terminal processing protease CtpA/Prc